jgi:hypothetical protein
MGSVVEVLPHGCPHSGIITGQPYGGIGLDQALGIVIPGAVLENGSSARTQ